MEKYAKTLLIDLPEEYRVLYHALWTTITMEQVWMRADKKSVMASDIWKECAVLLTDTKEMAKCAKQFAGACMVYVPSDANDSTFVEGADIVLEQLEELDDDLIEEILCHTKHYPLQISSADAIELREISVHDSEFLQSISDEEGQLFAGGSEDCFREDKITAYVQSFYPLFGYGLWIVRYEGVRAGVCGFGHLEQGEKVYPELQYYLCPQMRGKGIAEKMCRLALRYLANQYEEQEVWIRIKESNDRSIHLAQKLGFAAITENAEESIADETAEIYLKVDLKRFAC